MSRLRLSFLAAVACLLLTGLPAQASIPRVLTYSGYVKTAAGAAVTTPTDLTFRLYTGATGGAAVWTEAVSVTPSSDGWFSAVLGTTSPLLATTFDQDLYLSLQVGTDVELTPRARVTPSGSALVVDWSGVQGKPTCATGQYLTLDGTGTLLCTTPTTGTGGLTSVLTAAPISGTGVSGSAVTLTPCANGQILQSNGTIWSCIATPTGGTGGVTGVTATAPVVSSGGAAPVISMAANPTFSGTVTATTFAGNLTGTATTATTALSANAVAANVITPSDLNTGTAPVAGQLPSKATGDSFTWVTPLTGPTLGCAANQVLSWNGSALGCVFDANSGGTITSVVAGAGLTGGAATGAATLTVDTTTIQARVAGTCAAGSSIRAIAANGTVTCDSPAPRTRFLSIDAAAASIGGSAAKVRGVSSALSGAVLMPAAGVPQVDFAFIVPDDYVPGTAINLDIIWKANTLVTVGNTAVLAHNWGAMQRPGSTVLGFSAVSGGGSTTITAAQMVMTTTFTLSNGVSTFAPAPGDAISYGFFRATGIGTDDIVVGGLRVRYSAQ